MSPSPNTGVGVRKITLLLACWEAKFSCTRLQPDALPVASERPVITNSEWTPPSGAPPGWILKRASRMGPFAVMNEGSVFCAPNAVAVGTCGFAAGEVPPIAGCV